MKGFIAAAILILTTASGSANAQYINGMEYVSWADAADRATAGSQNYVDSIAYQRLSNYTLGVADAARFRYCSPDSVVAGQLVAISIKYMRTHPEEWNLMASDLILKALLQAFPCKK